MRQTTYWEKQFIDQLGQYSTKGQTGEISRKELLQGYLASIPKRMDWSDIGAIQILQYAQKALAKCHPL